jgi:hypothetical protein
MLLFAALTVAAPAAPAQAQTPVYREIKEWMLGCDNLGNCEAKYAGEGAMGYLSVTRAAGPQGTLTVDVATVADREIVPDPKALSLDGHPVTAGLPWHVAKDADSIRLDGAAAVRFIAMLRNAKTLSYPGDGAPATVSLDGMTAALLAMDAAQGRIGTVTALIRPGGEPAAHVLPAAPMPVVHAVVTAATMPDAKRFASQVRAAVGGALKANDCDDRGDMYDKAAPLNAREAIVALGCLLGAKHSSSLLFRAPRNNPRAARLLILPLQPTVDPHNAPGGLYTDDGDGWDPKTATYEEAAVDTAMNDCGTSTQWAFDGKDFRLVSFSRSDKCAGPPGDLLQLYQSKLVSDHAP